MSLHQQTAIPGFERSYALISTYRQTRTAVVFVHGFWGDSYTTWRDFQILVDECASRYDWCQTSDLYFFEYSAASNYVGPSAGKLRKFLSYVFPVPPDSLFQEDISDVDWAHHLKSHHLSIRKGPYEYTKLVLVGHSLGGLIVRKLIYDEVKRMRDGGSKSNPNAKLLSRYPILNADVRLISPAHLGFQAAGPAGALFMITNIGATLRVFLTCFRAFIELDPKSELIKNTRSETEKFAGRYSNVPALSANVLWADKEDIVVRGEYKCDHAPTYPERNTNHINVCKPVRSYQEPLGFVGGSTMKAYGKGGRISITGDGQI